MKVGYLNKLCPKVPPPNMDVILILVFIFLFFSYLNLHLFLYNLFILKWSKDLKDWNTEMHIILFLFERNSKLFKL